MLHKILASLKRCNTVYSQAAESNLSEMQMFYFSKQIRSVFYNNIIPYENQIECGVTPQLQSTGKFGYQALRHYKS